MGKDDITFRPGKNGVVEAVRDGKVMFFATPFCRKLQIENVGYCRTVLQVLAPTFCRFLQSTLTARFRLTYILQTYRYWFTRMWFALPAAVKARFWSARLHGSRQGKPKASCRG